MKLFVIGATGGVGQEVIKQAIDQGHHVTAFVRTPSKVELEHEHLHIIKGDGLDKASLVAAMKGHDAVICTVGNATMGKTELMSTIVHHLIVGMKQWGISKIVYCASAGIHKELPGLIGKAVMFVLRHVLADHARSYNLLESSSLEWTIVRPMSLTNEQNDKPYQVAGDKQPPKGMKVSRKAVAELMVQIATTNQYQGQSIGISY